MRERKQGMAGVQQNIVSKKRALPPDLRLYLATEPMNIRPSSSSDSGSATSKKTTRAVSLARRQTIQQVQVHRY